MKKAGYIIKTKCRLAITRNILRQLEYIKRTLESAADVEEA